MDRHGAVDAAVRQVLGPENRAASVFGGRDDERIPVGELVFALQFDGAEDQVSRKGNDAKTGEGLDEALAWMLDEFGQAK